MDICHGSKPPMSAWSANCGSGSRTSWNSVWLVNRPSVALMAIQVGASSHTWLPLRIRAYRRRPSSGSWARAAGSGSACSGTP